VESVLGGMIEASLADIPRDKAVYYSCRDADATLRVYQSLSPDIDTERLRFVLESMELPFQRVALQMMQNGMPVDVGELESISESLAKEMGEIAEHAADVAGAYVGDGEPYPFNPSSDTQVSELVYERLGYPPTKLTDKTRRPSVDDRELKKVRVYADGVTADYGDPVFDSGGKLHPIIPPILQYRERAVVKDTFADGFRSRAVDGVVYSELRTTTVETGRLSAADPNILAVPVRTEIGRRVRGAMISRPGYLLVEADYSQIEMRLVMSLSGCEAGIRLFREGRDIHTETAAHIFGIHIDDARDSKYRYPVKRLGFGTVYMITAHGLHEGLIDEGVTDWSTSDCTKFIMDWDKLYPEVRVYQRHQIEFARRYKYVEDMFGRRRYVPELMCPVRWIRSAGERQAANMPVQSAAAGILKLATDAIRLEYADDFDTAPTAVRSGAISRWIIEVHDSALWEVWGGMAFNRASDYKAVMEEVVKLQVPVVVDVKVGETWGDMVEIG
jgi:DNA polymerase-1